MGLSDWVEILPSSRLSALRVSSTRLQPAPSTTETVPRNPPNFRDLNLNKIAGF
jgi:hypothetical protein